jgi:omega-amidase
VATCGRAGDKTIAWDPWGHSAITNPQGQTIASTGLEETILYADIDPAEVKQARDALGVESGSRFDLYEKYI